MMKTKFYQFLATSLACMGLCACHFGRSAEEMMNEYNDVERDLLFTMSTSGPDGSVSSRTAMTDNQVNGVVSKWVVGDAIAIFDFGKVFYDGEDETNGSPMVPCLNFEKNDDLFVGDDIDDAIFTGVIHSKMGEKTANGKNFALVQPYSSMVTYYSDETDVTLDFTGQDGTLERLASVYQYAWGMGKGVCQKGVVELTDLMPNCNVDWHDHSVGERVVLDNKMAIIRFSVLYQPTDEDGVYQGKPYALSQYLAENDLTVSYIDIENMDESEGFTRANLNLSSGMVSAAADAETTIRLESPFGFLTLSDLKEEDGIVGANDVRCWGTTFYLAVPCPENRMLPLHPMVKIHTCDARTHVESDKIFYGTLSTHIIKEANYYMSSPIITVDNKLHLVESAKLFLYYHSSFVWAPTTIE